MLTDEIITHDEMERQATRNGKKIGLHGKQICN